MEVTLDLRPHRVAIIVGIDHKIQHFIPNIAPNDPRNILRLHFQTFLGGFTASYPVDVICEEAKHGEGSIAHDLAIRERIKYRNIEMPPERRTELGIPKLYTIDPESEIPPEQVKTWNEQRETHMINQLLHATGRARAMIVICGLFHLPAVCTVLSLKFKHVEPHDVTTKRWFNRSML